MPWRLSRASSTERNAVAAVARFEHVALWQLSRTEHEALWPLSHASNT
jgi:hypothetical protein